MLERWERWADRVDAFNNRVGELAAWLAVYMVLVQFAIVILRYVFSLSFIATVESVIYAHGLLFMLGTGYTLLHGGHVRVDIFYREISPRRQAMIDLAGSLLFVFPLVLMTMWLSSSLILNSWAVLEGSEEAGGLPLLFLYKTVIWLFAGLLGMQSFSVAVRAWLYISGRTGEYVGSADNVA